MFGTPFGTKQRQYSSASTYVKDNLVLEKKTILIYHILICLCPHSVLQHFLRTFQKRFRPPKQWYYNLLTFSASSLSLFFQSKERAAWRMTTKRKENNPLLHVLRTSLSMTPSMLKEGLLPRWGYALVCKQKAYKPVSIFLLPVELTHMDNTPNTTTFYNINFYVNEIL